MRKVLILCCCILALTSVSAQDLDWAFDLRVISNVYGTWESDIFETDKNGNSVLAGIFLDSADFNPDTSATRLLHSGACPDLFIARYTADGLFSWSYKIDVNSMTGFNYLAISDVDFDGGGNVYLAGEFRGRVIFHGQNSADTVVGHNAHNDAFIVKYSPNGQFLWFKRMGGELDPTTVLGFDVTSNGDIFMSGIFVERLYFNYPSKARATSLYADIKSYHENYIVRLDLNGNFQWAHMFTGPGVCHYLDLETDAQKNVFFFGLVNDSIFLDSTSNLIAVPKSWRDILLLKMDGSGNLLNNKLVWTNSSQSNFTDLDVSNNGDFTILGKFSKGSLYFDTVNSISTSLFSDDFIATFDNNLNFKRAFTFNGSSPYIHPNALNVSDDGSTHVVGWYSGNPDFDLTTDTFFVQCKNPNGENFIAIYDTVYSAINVLTFERPSLKHWHNFNAVRSDEDNNIYVYGFNGDSCDFDPSEDTVLLNGYWFPRVTQGCLWNSSVYGSPSVFIAKYRYCQAPEVPIGPGPDHSCLATDVSLYVGVSGDTPLHYQWYKDNVPIPNSNSAYLQIYNLQYSDSGQYICVVTNDCGIIVSDTLEFKVLDCTGMDEFSSKGKVMLLPNPSKGELIIRLLDKQFSVPTNIRISDIQGHVVYENRIPGDYFELTLDSEVSNGLYLVEFINGNQKFYSKLIIDR